MRPEPLGPAGSGRRRLDLELDLLSSEGAPGLAQHVERHAPRRRVADQHIEQDGDWSVAGVGATGASSTTRGV